MQYYRHRAISGLTPTVVWLAGANGAKYRGIKCYVAGRAGIFENITCYYYSLTTSSLISLSKSGCKMKLFVQDRCWAQHCWRQCNVAWISDISEAGEKNEVESLRLHRGDTTSFCHHHQYYRQCLALSFL
jgi:hypothetical protein